MSAAPLASPFGFTYGKRDELVWLRAPDGRYKRLNPELLELLLQLGKGEIAADDLEASARAAADQLASEGFFVAGADAEERLPPPDVALAPRLLLFGALFAAVAALVYVRQDLAWPPPADPWVNAIAIPFFIISGVLHELGHYFASRPYFKASIRLGLLSGIIPAFITKTNDAWACPRGIRIWINLAGPLVDLLIALALAVLHLTVLPDVHLIVTLILVQLVRVVFVLNPLLEGDGYWLLSDLLGAVNLRTRGLADLRRFRPSGYALYALLSLAFTALCVVLLGRIVLAFVGWL